MSERAPLYFEKPKTFDAKALDDLREGLDAIGFPVRVAITSDRSVKVTPTPTKSSMPNFRRLVEVYCKGWFASFSAY